jgi:predicted lipid-binding transport protein (Tim44 family)
MLNLRMRKVSFFWITLSTLIACSVAGLFYKLGFSWGVTAVAGVFSFVLITVVGGIMVTAGRPPEAKQKQRRRDGADSFDSR